MDAKTAKAAGEPLRAQAIEDVKTRGGPGAIKSANAQRIEWDMAKPSERAKDRFPSVSGVADPGVNALAAFVLAGGVDFLGCCDRTARYGHGPVANFMTLTKSVKDRRPEKRLPDVLSKVRGRMMLEPTELADDRIEALEAMRYDDPRAALEATKAALKQAAGPVALGRLLAVHASNLREVDELAEALLALRVAIPALDVAGDLWGVGRALTGAAGVTQACGDFVHARGLVNQGESFYIRAGSATGRGSAMAVRGALAVNVGNTRAGLREMNAALTLLSDPRRVAGVQQTKALVLAEVGELPGAREAVAIALATVPHGAAALRGRIAWSAADIESKAGSNAAAEALYRQAFDLISEPLCDRLLVFDQADRAARRQRETASTARRKRLRRQIRTSTSRPR